MTHAAFFVVSGLGISNKSGMSLNACTVITLATGLATTSAAGGFTVATGVAATGATGGFTMGATGEAGTEATGAAGTEATDGVRTGAGGSKMNAIRRRLEATRRVRRDERRLGFETTRGRGRRREENRRRFDVTRLVLRDVTRLRFDVTRFFRDATRRVLLVARLTRLERFLRNLELRFNFLRFVFRIFLLFSNSGAVKAKVSSTRAMLKLSSFRHTVRSSA